MPSLADLPATSLVLACDMEPDQLERVVGATKNVNKVASYKIGAAIALQLGLAEVVRRIRAICQDAVIIYDHQKAGTDIPDTATEFMKTLRRCAVDAVILFPLAGPATQSSWITAAQANKLDVIVGGHMTHGEYLASEGGYIDDAAVPRLFEAAAESGIRNFVVPGNQPQAIERIRNTVSKGEANVALFAPGFVTQGGDLTDAARIAGPRFHAIVGRHIFNAPDPGAAAQQMTQKL